MSETKKILIVDDDLNIHEFYAEMFADFAVTFCTNGEDGVARIEKGEIFDLIYLDLELLGMSGFSTLDAMKGIAGDKLPPVVVSSSLSDEETQNTARVKGAVGFVPKPVNLQQAISVAHKLLTGGAAPPAK
jgi:CheY-like chemotaxis protein